MISSDITQDIRTAYKSTDRPNWSFVADRIKKHPYKEVIAPLKHIYAVSESTDLNDDYSRCFSLVNKTCELTLRLSLVGKYACIHDKQSRFQTENELSKSSCGVKLLQLLAFNRIKLLQENELRCEVQLGGEKKLLYAVLFSSDELI